MLDAALPPPPSEDRQRDAQQAMDLLAAPLRGEPAGMVEDPLFAAVAAVVRALGMEPARPAAWQGLAALARANGLRLRPLQLEHGWWRWDAGPLLLLTESGPVAVLPRGGRGYALFDPTDGAARHLAATEAAALRGEAFQLYAPLPSAALTARDIARRALGWSRGDVATILGLTLLAGLLGLGMPLATGFMVEILIPAHDLPGLVEIGLVLAVLAAVSAALRLAVQVAAVRIEGHAGTRLQAAVMDRLLRLPATFFRGFTAGDLAQRAMAIQAIERAVGSSLIGSLVGGLAALMAVAMMLAQAPKLALVALVPMLLLAGATLGLGLLRRRRDMAQLPVEGRKAALLLQLTQGVGKLRQAMAEDRAFLRWARLQAEAMRHHMAGERIGRVSELIGALYGPLTTALIFGTAYWMAGHEAGRPVQPALPLGTLSAFLAAFAQANAGLTGLAGVLVQLASLQPLYRHAAPILEAVPEAAAGQTDPGRLSGAVALRDIGFRYAADAPALFEKLSLEVAAGEFVAIVGPSGAGKSSLIRLLLRFEVPQAGMVQLDGRDLAGLDIAAVRRQFGVVLQNDRLMPATLLDNILGAHSDLTEGDAWRAAAQVGLAEDIRGLPMGMRTMIADGGVLSGGQAQRVLLARALAARPRILLLDEATSALDNRTQAAVMQSLEALDITRIVVAHRLSTVAQADRIIVLEDGAVRETGRYEALLRANGPFSRLAARQML